MSTSTVILLVVGAALVIGAVYFFTRPGAIPSDALASGGQTVGGTSEAGSIIGGVGSAVSSLTTAIGNLVLRSQQQQREQQERASGAAS